MGRFFLPSEGHKDGETETAVICTNMAAGLKDRLRLDRYY
jgi:hypothetical protein